MHPRDHRRVDFSPRVKILIYFKRLVWTKVHPTFSRAPALMIPDLPLFVCASRGFQGDRIWLSMQSTPNDPKSPIYNCTHDEVTRSISPFRPFITSIYF